MKLFAIGDLHMPGGDDKPMDVFGGHWTDHVAQISGHWRELVGEEDVVLIPGDISWAMQLNAAVPDLETIAELPGRKILCKGNHDYWWSSLSQVCRALPAGMEAWGRAPAGGSIRRRGSPFRRRTSGCSSGK